MSNPALSEPENFEPRLHDNDAEAAPTALAGLPGLMCEAKLQEFARLVQRQLELLGENPDRDGIEKTPMRVAKAFEFLTRGYWQCPKKVLNDALFDVKSDEMVI